MVCDQQQNTVDNIASTIKHVLHEYAQLEQMPQDQIIASMNAYRSRRRKK